MLWDLFESSPTVSTFCNLFTPDFLEQDENLKKINQQAQTFLTCSDVMHVRKLCNVHKKSCDLLNVQTDVIEMWHQKYVETFDYDLSFKIIFKDCNNIYSCFKKDKTFFINSLRSISQCIEKEIVIFYIKNCFITDFKEIVHDLDLLRFCIEYCGVNLMDEKGETLLMNAVRYRQLAAMVVICNCSEVDLDAQNSYGRSAVFMTCGKLHKGKSSLLDYLSVYGARLDVIDNNGDTLFYYAAKKRAYATIYALNKIVKIDMFRHMQLVQKLPASVRKVLFQNK